VKRKERKAERRKTYQKVRAMSRERENSARVHQKNHHLLGGTLG